MARGAVVEERVHLTHCTFVGSTLEVHAQRRQNAPSPAQVRRVASGLLGCMCLAAIFWTVKQQDGEVVLAAQNPSDAAARIIGTAEGFHRKTEDFKTEETDVGNSALEENYGAVATSIVTHGNKILDRLLGKLKEPPDFSVPMPGASPPPPPSPSLPDQGAVAAKIVSGGAAERAANTKLADTSASPPHAAPDILTPTWTNAGGAAEDNVFQYPDTYVPADSPDREAKGRNYFHTKNGESADEILGALGGGWRTGTTAGTGPSVQHWTDNGSAQDEGFTISTKDDDVFHSVKPSWIPIGRAGKEEETGAGMDDPDYLGVYGRTGPSTVPPKGHAVSVNVGHDNGGTGESFSFSTAADAFDCGDHCQTADLKPGPNATATAPSTP